ncbi:MAG: discoidin domain-containing protein [Myxococcota bacterium]
MRPLIASLVLALPLTAWAGAKVSAFQKGKSDANANNGAAAIDGKLNTGWMVPGESENKGEWIEIDLPQGEVDKFAIFPGNNKNDEAWGDYPRVKKVRVDIYALDDTQTPQQVGTATLDVADKREMQVFDIPDAKIAAGLFGGKAKVTILDTWDGEDFPNLAVAEMQLYLKEFDAVPKLLSVSAGEDKKDALLDGNPKTPFTAPIGETTITLNPNGFGVSSVGFVPVGKDYARPKTVEITVGALKKTTVLADDLKNPQFAETPGFNGFNGGAFGEIEIKIVDVYPGTKPEIGIADLKPKATNLESF